MLIEDSAVNAGHKDADLITAIRRRGRSRSRGQSPAEGVPVISPARPCWYTIYATGGHPHLLQRRRDDRRCSMSRPLVLYRGSLPADGGPVAKRGSRAIPIVDDAVGAADKDSDQTVSCIPHRRPGSRGQTPAEVIDVPGQLVPSGRGLQVEVIVRTPYKEVEPNPIG